MAEDRGPLLEAAVLSLLVLCLVSVSLRIYTMALILKRFLLEDYLAILALVRCRSPQYTAYTHKARTTSTSPGNMWTFDLRG